MVTRLMRMINVVMMVMITMRGVGDGKNMTIMVMN